MNVSLTANRNYVVAASDGVVEEGAQLGADSRRQSLASNCYRATDHPRRATAPSCLGARACLDDEVAAVNAVPDGDGVALPVERHLRS
jgi:hypothetical protein